MDFVFKVVVLKFVPFGANVQNIAINLISTFPSNGSFFYIKLSQLNSLWQK